MGMSIMGLAGGIWGVIKKIPKTAWTVTKKVAPIAAVVLPAGKIRNVARAIAAATPLIGNIFKKETRMSEEKPSVESLVRALIEFARNVHGKSVLEILMSLGPIISASQAAATELSGTTTEEQAALFRTALDNMIGTEADAIIGPAQTALLSVNIPLIGDTGFETATDFLLDLVARAWANQQPTPAAA